MRAFKINDHCLQSPSGRTPGGYNLKVFTGYKRDYFGGIYRVFTGENNVLLILNLEAFVRSVKPGTNFLEFLVLDLTDRKDQAGTK